MVFAQQSSKNSLSQQEMDELYRTEIRKAILYKSQTGDYSKSAKEIALAKLTSAHHIHYSGIPAQCTSYSAKNNHLNSNVFSFPEYYTPIQFMTFKRGLVIRDY